MDDDARIREALRSLDRVHLAELQQQRLVRALRDSRPTAWQRWLDYELRIPVSYVPAAAVLLLALGGMVIRPLMVGPLPPPVEITRLFYHGWEG